MDSSIDPRNLPFGMYDIDGDLLDKLRGINDNIPNSDYEEHGGAKKFYCGPVAEHEGVPLFVPVSHQTKPAPTPGQDIPYTRLITDKGENVGSLNYKYMVPVADARFIEPRTNLGAYGQKQADCCMAMERSIKADAREKHNEYVDFENIKTTAHNINDLIDANFELADELDARMEAETKTPAPIKQPESKPNIMDSRVKTANTLSTNSITNYSNDFSKV